MLISVLLLRHAKCNVQEEKKTLLIPEKIDYAKQKKVCTLYHRKLNTVFGVMI